MACKVVFLLLCLTFVIASTSAIRDIPIKITSGSGNLVDCWNAVMEIKSCSNEIILFFVNGPTNNINIGAECCRAIGIITRNCWPAMLTSLGFTAEETDILRGYCDNSDSDSAAAPPLAATSPTPSN
ncbi:egg cell-secreted protein 1.4-like [Mercurialis annua]|uniref:egg cell-secreted protein 1.4-like n=1 Tax=Mercurialis annua TaxID=3986 RepID=UPI00215EC451|nr:egg cell-secreted protein 1.4-like [Mercurialis annua]